MATPKRLSISDIVLNSSDILEVSKEIGSALTETPNADTKWHEFAMDLMGNNCNVGIKAIKQKYNDFGDRCKALLDLWKQQASEEPRWDRVEEVLRKNKLNEPARKLHSAITSLNSTQLPLRETDHARQPTSQDETDYGPPPKKPKHHRTIDEEELKQKYKDKFPDGTFAKKKQGDDLQQEILIQTVNEREFYAVMIKLKNASVYTVMTNEYPDKSYYYVGQWGDKGIPVVIVQTTMGSDGPHGSYNETRKALSCLPNLKYIFAVGVCGGAKGKVELGDVVVSKVLQDCSLEVYEDGKVITRSHSWPATGNFYHFLSQTANKPDIMRCEMVLSANKLLKDYSFQKKLLVQFPKANAFEMEGHGIGRACEESKKKEIEFLVVKGVSDLADKDKNDDWQPQAAVNAADALYEVMAKYDGFDYGEEDYGSSTSVAAEKVQTEQGRSHQQIEDQDDMQDARAMQGAQENVNVEDENKTKEDDEIQAAEGKGKDDEMQAGDVEGKSKDDKMQAGDVKGKGKDDEMQAEDLES